MRLNQQQTEEEEFQNEVNQKLLRNLRRAQSVKTTFEQEQAMVCMHCSCNNK